ncbi:MAG: DUF86 domain-containing protein [Duncaniella sp.]|nr:DUF86 domain-containing protein [Duncaniella sp.]
MREKPRDPARLQHILLSIDNVLKFMNGKTRDDLTTDNLLYFAVVKNIEIIGEAAYKLTREFVESHPATPWRQIIAMRHVLVHGYYEISVEEIFGVIRNRVIPLREQIVGYLAEF